jgi:hypothetical protein
MAMGNSMTFGFMREELSAGHTERTPRYSSPWSSYPGVSNWQALDPPWNVPANRTDPGFQGYRGVLASKLPGFLWIGEDTNDHGPKHMGYSGGKVLDIIGRYPQPTIETDPCYAIVIYFAGLNDLVSGSVGAPATTVFGDWETGFQQIANQRDGKGKTLVVSVMLPQMANHYHTANRTQKQAELSSFNALVAGYTPTFPHLKKSDANTESIPHDNDAGTQDDGLHYFDTGFSAIADVLYGSIEDGLK